MNNTDLVTIFGNLSQSLYPVQHFITGFAYVLGIVFFFSALEKLKKLAASHGQHSSQESIFTPLMYMLFGALMIYLPSAMDTMANTAFGVNNVIAYPTTVDRTNIIQTVGLLIRTVGLIWFIRGCVLLAHASQPGTDDHGYKGILFLFAGVLCMNFDSTVSGVNSTLSYFISLTMSFKASVGY